MNSNKTKDHRDKSELEYPGVAIDTADENKVTPQTLRQRTYVLDNNPASDQPFDDDANSHTP